MTGRKVTREERPGGRHTSHGERCSKMLEELEDARSGVEGLLGKEQKSGL